MNSYYTISFKLPITYALRLFLVITTSVCAAQTEKVNEEVGFKRGNKIIFNDNFSKDATGDFPARWSSNGAGEVKVINGFEGKLFEIPAGTTANIQLQKLLPNNFTYELDVIVPSDIPLRMMGIGFGAKPVNISNMLSPRNAVHFTFQTNNKKIAEGLKYGSYEVTGAGAYKTIDYKTPLDKLIHLAFEINEKRIRLYVDNKKMVDMPNGYNPQTFKSLYLTAIVHGAKESKENYFYVANVTLAETVKDLRSQVIKDLFENGRASTTAIQFKVNSDLILAESSEIINDLVAAMKVNTSVKIKIVGHTDSDGDDAKNMELSKKRATAVKNKMASLGVAQNRMITDGKGESQPATENSSPEGKAQNRRVEFIKL